uniref:Uncharacterized protein n=1 Tax=Rhabditophanes sp. KR3021 TaxID=114890 RepID=A0AC35TTH1_9BILA
MDIPPLPSPLFQYDYTVERRALQTYEIEMKKVNDENEDRLMKKLAISNSTEDIFGLTSSPKNCQAPFIFDLSYSSGVSNNTTTSNPVITEKKKKVEIDFSEFERSRDVFDIVTLNSLDEKAELAQLLSRNPEPEKELLPQKISTPKNTAASQTPTTRGIFQYPSMPSSFFTDTGLDFST